MPTPWELEDEEAARRAEEAAAAIGGFPSDLNTPPQIGANPIDRATFDKVTSSPEFRDEMNRSMIRRDRAAQRPMDLTPSPELQRSLTPPESSISKGLRSLGAMTGPIYEAARRESPAFAKTVDTAAKLGSEGLGLAMDVGETAGAPLLTAGSALGTMINKVNPIYEATGLRRDPEQTVGSVLYKGASDLGSIPYRVGSWLGLNEGKREGLAHDVMGKSVEAMQGEGAYPKLAGLGGLAATVMSFPSRELLPGIPNPAFKAGEHVSDVLGGPVTPLAGLPGARRGVLNIAGSKRPEDLAYKRVYEAAEELVLGKEGAAGLGKRSIQDKFPEGSEQAAKFDAATLPAFENLGRYAQMDDAALRQALANNMRAGLQAARRATPVGLAEDVGGLATTQEERIVPRDLVPPGGVKEPTARAMRGLTPEQIKLNVKNAQSLIDAHPGGPPSEELLSALNQIPGYRKGKGNPLGDILEGLGGKKSQNKERDLAAIRDRLESKVAPNETPIRNIEDLQKAEEMDVAAQAEEFKPKTAMEQILDRVDRDGGVTVTIEGGISREQVRQVEEAAAARGMTAAFDGSGFLIRKNPKEVAAQAETAAKAEKVAKEGPKVKTWREAFDAAPDEFYQNALLRKIAEKTRDPATLDEVLALAGDQPYHSNLYWDIAHNPKVSPATREKAMARYEEVLSGDKYFQDGEQIPVLEPETAQAPGGPPSAVPAPAPSPPAPGGGAPPTGPIRTATPPAGAWQGVNRPGPPEIGPPRVPTPPRRNPVQGPKPQPAAAPERQYTGAALNTIDTLENASTRAGNAAGKKLAEDLREIINNGESSAARPVAEWNDRVRAVARNAKAVDELAGDANGLVTPAAWERAGVGNWKVGRFQANTDANAAKMGIRPEDVALTQPESKALVQEYWKWMQETGREAERLGVKTADGSDFVAQVKRMVQQPDSSAKSWMVEGNPEFEDFVQEARRIYPFADPQALRGDLQAWAGQSLDRPAAFEFHRKYPMLPATRTSRITGEELPVLKYDVLPTAINPEGSVQQLIKAQHMRLAGIERLGQDVTLAMADDPANVAGLLNQTPLGKALAADPDTLDAAKKAIGAIYGRAESGLISGKPVAETALGASRSVPMQLLRSAINRVTPALNLGLQSLKSFTQTTAEVPAMTGAINYAKAIARVATKYNLSAEEARAAGALHEKMLMAGSEVFDRHRIVESVFGANVNRLPTERMNDFVKDLNDTIAFTAGKFKAEEMIAKGAKNSDFLMMDEMNLPQSTQNVFRNPAAFDDAARTKAVQDFGRRVAQETQFHSKNRALRGRFENDQWIRFAIPYMQYSVNTMKRTYRDFERVWRMSGKGIREDAGILGKTLGRLNPFGETRDPFRNAVGRLMTRTLGFQASGEVIADISSALQGKDPFRRDRSAVARFLENMRYASFLGPLQLIADQLSAHVLKRLGGDTKETIKSFTDSKPIEMQNPALGAATKVGMELLQGDVGGAAYEATVGQSPLLKGVGRATGVLPPAGERQRSTRVPTAKHPFLDGQSATKHPFLDGAKASKHPFLDTGKKGGKHPFLQ